MKTLRCVRTLTLLVPMLGALSLAELSAAQVPPASAAATLPSETPAQFTPVTDSFDYARRDVMIPMRDGVKLHTVVLVPKGAKNGSEGDYVMTRPLRGPLNPTAVDHSTDTYDTIDWLVKNIPESNGRVGILGISYDGFLPLMA